MTQNKIAIELSGKLMVVHENFSHLLIYFNIQISLSAKVFLMIV